jgi:hypothetical protein
LLLLFAGLSARNVLAYVGSELVFILIVYEELFQIVGFEFSNLEEQN